MKKQVRLGVFETNSSSTHTLTICTKKEYDKWKNGKTVLDEWTNKFVDIEELTDKEMQSYYESMRKPYYKDYKDLDTFEKQTLKEEYIRNEVNGTTYLDWVDDDDLETYTENYISESGDTIVVFGKYGYN